MHKGIDCAMANHTVTDIVAASDGTVVKVGPASGFGNWIVIEHRNSTNVLVATTVYGHMNDGNIFVTVGQKVGGGQKIAKEGNAGIGSAAHLHFELHRGAWGNPVDPLPYINGTLTVADNNLPGQMGVADPSSMSTSTRSNTAMTSGEQSANSTCPDITPNQTAPSTSEPALPPSPSSPASANAHRSDCAPATSTVDVSGVISKIEQACSEDTSITTEDTKFILIVAKIESGYDPFAKNPTSSATGLYQFLDKLAVKYYGLIGYPVTCANRCDPYIATKAMIAFYKAEIKHYWNDYVASGKTTIAGKTIVATDWSVNYPSFTQGEFMYGIVQHDGIGNAIAGKDLGGVNYYRTKVRTA